MQLCKHSNYVSLNDVTRTTANNQFIISFAMADAAATKYRLLLKSAVSELVGHELITIKCSSQLTAAYVLYILKQVSQTFARSCQSSIDSAIVTPKKKQPKTEQQNADMSWACTKHQHTCRVIEKTASVSAIAIE